MELTHDFTVPTGWAATWAAFTDLQAVAQCFPGAAVTGVEGDSFEGSCKVKLGPIALVYNGSGTFTEKDEAAGRLAISAKGKDKRGNGTAGADVTMTMTEAGPAETRVSVLTQLQITGKPAQFGRGVMQDVSDKLLAQFVDCLEQKRAGTGDAAPEPEPAARPVAEEAAESTPPPRATPAWERPPAQPPPAPAGGDAIDLGATVVPVLLRTYRKQLVVAAVAVALLVWWRRRRR